MESNATGTWGSKVWQVFHFHFEKSVRRVGAPALLLPARPNAEQKLMEKKNEKNNPDRH
jgi:hypothetical protein